jgi:phosphoribosyl 1,2-cyclic phosphate phosphodiesterase
VVLIDAGPDFRQQALRERITRVDAVLVTHSHQDHIGGLDELRQVNVVDGGKQAVPVPIYGDAQSIADIRQRFDYVWNAATPTGGGLPQLALHELKPFVACEVAPGVVVTPIAVMHGQRQILGYSFGRSLTYITDCSVLPDDTMAMLCDGGSDGARPETLVLNALRPKEHPTHITIDRAIEIATQIAARQTFLVHLAHNLTHERLLTLMPPRVTVAVDRQRVAIGKSAPTQKKFDDVI